MLKTKKWKTQKEAFEESLAYIDARRKGKITSVKTQWNSFNAATTDGIEWNSTTIIGARPATGKTLIKSLLVNGAFKLNPMSKFRVLEFQFEMVGKVAAIREFSSYLQKSYKELCSVGYKVSDDELSLCVEYAKERLKFPIDVVDEPCGVIDFVNTIVEYMEEHSSMVMKPDPTTKKPVPVKQYTNTIITLDHSLLLDNAPYGNDMDMLKALGKALTKLKRKYPIAFIILSQLNRNIDAPERNEDGKYGNFVLESDIFGSDALLQHADTLIGLNRPGKQKIRYYGTERYIIEDPKILAMHFIKCRNSEVGVAFFRTEFATMNMVEIPPPPKHERRGMKI